MSTFFPPQKYTTNSKPQSNMDDGILNGSRLSLYSQTSNFHALRVSFIKTLEIRLRLFFGLKDCSGQVLRGRGENAVAKRRRVQGVRGYNIV